MHATWKAGDQHRPQSTHNRFGSLLGDCLKHEEEGVDTYMKCGCVAQGVLTSKGGVALDKPIPACVVHDCTEIADKPDLSGRMAKCCDKSQVRPSSFDLAFFEYQGPGSRESTEMCKCGYHLVAHTSGRSKCKTFVARGPREFDRYYCGHGGWD